MKLGQAALLSIFFSLVILSGWFISFNFWWEKYPLSLVVGIGFLMIPLGSVFVSIPLVRLLFRQLPDFNYSTFTIAAEYEDFTRSIEKSQIRKVTITITLVFSLILSLSLCLLFSLTERHKKNQLRLFGQVQKIKIKNTGYKGKGGRRAFFDFYLNGKGYSDNLPDRNYIVGDSAFIIFSAENPAIVTWRDEPELTK
jgi:hypothetical protein